MKRKTPAEINARNRKRAHYRNRLLDRLTGASGNGPLEITPEIEQALSTPVTELPKDMAAQGALRRAGADGDPLAHLRLAKARTLKRAVDARRRIDAAKPGANARRDIGDRSRKRVEQAARAVLRSKPKMTRKQLAETICSSIGLSADRTLTLLKKIGLPPSRR